MKNLTKNELEEINGGGFWKELWNLIYCEYDNRRNLEEDAQNC